MRLSGARIWDGLLRTDKMSVFFAEEHISLAFQDLKTQLHVIIRQDCSQMIDSARFWIVFLARLRNFDTRAFSWSHCAHICVFHA